ncbi:MAG TPA: DEAD/DEAH box helicase family protein, partial [Rubrivivax sp.]|nr:DEAD/DEAH box helicase family protein [Rubrivivax sp.]
DALDALRQRLQAVRHYASEKSPQVFPFSAPTGSGKTLMMAALFEAILDEPDDQLGWPDSWQPQPDAAILWVSDMPELNEQTRLKIEKTSDRVHRVKQLVTIDADFDAERLAGGRIYFINTQKLGSDKLLTKTGDGRSWSIWTTLANTARAIPDRFYVVIDEAHRGMTSGKGLRDAQTLMQRFLLGHAESGLVRMPLVIGISATPTRFVKLLAEAKAGHSQHPVHVSSEDVRRSGLLKDRILIHHPEAPTQAEMGLLEAAARRWARMTQAWGAYCAAEGDGRVWPVLVVQVENASGKDVTRTPLADALTAIESAIGRRLNEGEGVHAFNDTGDLDIGGRKLRRIEASRIDGDKNIGVVFFKTSLSTGWDCPRAEVMMSFRRAEDHTYIAQLLGRMVRTPLARRIARDAALNDVHLYLPHYDTAAVQAVLHSLQNVEDVPPAEAGSARELAVLTRRPGTEAVFAALGEAVTYRVGAVRSQSALRRYMGMARELTIDELDDAAWDDAKRGIVDWLVQAVAKLKAAGSFDALARPVTHVRLKTLASQPGSAVAEPDGTHEVEASDLDIERLFQDAGRVLTNGLHKTYWEAQAERDSTQVKVELVVLCRHAPAMSAVEDAAERAFNALYDQHKKAISKLPEAKRRKYDRLRLATAKPADVPWGLPESIDWRRTAGETPHAAHLFVDEAGRFACTLAGWEPGVLAEELARGDVAGWLRNLPHKPWSLEIPYESGGEVRPMFPDFVVVRQVAGQFVVDILEPHDASRDDNVDKARGLARFAERHGALFGRIQLIRKRKAAGGAEQFVRLEMNRIETMQSVLLVTQGPQLDALFDGAQ